MENNIQGTCSHLGGEHRKRVHGALIVMLVFLSLFLIAKSITEIREWRYIGAGIQAMNTINVQGEGEVFGIPDTATFSFSVIKEGKTADEVQQSAATVANNVIKYLKDQGIEEKDIKTVGYYVYPRYEQDQIVCFAYPCPQGNRKLIGFEINQSIEVKVRDAEKAGGLLSGVGGFGVENISGLSFTIDDEEGLKREARQKALADAKEKAHALADDLGVRLVRIVNFSEYGSPIYARLDSAVGLGMGGEGGKITPDVPAGENRIVSQVTITYEIR